VIFAEHIVRQEMKTGKMCFASWGDFTVKFMAMFCLENEATKALMWSEFKQYFQGRQNVEAYIDEFKDLMDLSRYTDFIMIVLKFCRGLNVTTQDRITKSGIDQPRDNDFDIQGYMQAQPQSPGK
jgi:hypothetical protein